MSWKASLKNIWRGDEKTVEESKPTMEAAGVDGAVRRTLPLPSILGPVRPPHALLPKATPANLRRFAETPLPRRAINVIKDRIASMDWQIRLRRGYTEARVTDAAQKMEVLRRTLEEPNNGDSFRSVIEQALEDALVGGFGAIEMELTSDPERPFALWPVDGATIQVNVNWDGSPDAARYAQFTNRVGPDARIPLRDDELMYIRVNPRSHTPFGLGSLEVAFETVNNFLAAHRYAGRLASNSVVQYALWMNEITPEEHGRMISWWQDEIEGTGRVPMLTSQQKPEVLKFSGGTDAELRLEWQSFLICMVGNAFGIPPMMLGMESDVTRSTASELADEAFRSTIAPMARLLAEHLTRDLFGKRLGWPEFEFVFNELDARDEMQEVQIQTALLTAGVLTVNEVRAARGLGPLEQGQPASLHGNPHALPVVAEE
ncbi:MAG TPA: phage portal protein [Acidobacteriaceae bacterium]|nr:phage portal protein [Acidobacteriaceae bacterium]